jgi:hypothetical protein
VESRCPSEPVTEYDAPLWGKRTDGACCQAHVTKWERGEECARNAENKSGDSLDRKAFTPAQAEAASARAKLEQMRVAQDVRELARLWSTFSRTHSKDPREAGERWNP